MADQFRRVVERGGARCVVLMMVTVKDVADRRFREPLGQLRLQPERELHVDRIREDDPGWRDEEDGVVIVVLDTVQIARQLRDAAHGRRRLLRVSSGSRRDEDENRKKARLHGGRIGQLPPPAAACGNLRQIARLTRPRTGHIARAVAARDGMSGAKP
jgi:hypothetical protein